MGVNTKAPWLCSIEASRLMPDGGHIVNLSSEGSRRVLPYYFSVGTSKAALEAVTRYLAIEFAEKNIAVNAVSGGYVETGALDHFPTKDQMFESGRDTPVGRMVTVEDIAGVVAFLCTDAASMIRGQVIVVDGGVTLKAE
jgi:enoyl-[acyl-carrier protein] reductase III